MKLETEAQMNTKTIDWFATLAETFYEQYENQRIRDDFRTGGNYNSRADPDYNLGKYACIVETIGVLQHNAGNDKEEAIKQTIYALNNIQKIEMAGSLEKQGGNAAFVSYRSGKKDARDWVIKLLSNMLEKTKKKEEKDE